MQKKKESKRIGFFKKRTKKELVSSLLINLSIIIIFLFLLFPIIWVIMLSFKTRTDILIWPPTFIFMPTLENFRSILFGSDAVTIGTVTTDFIKSYFNSLIITIGALIITLVAGIPAAYALAKYKFKGKESIAFTFLSFRFAPELLIIIPLFILFSKMGLYNTYFGIIWVYQLITLPMLIWILRGYIEEVPDEIEQAFMLDGYKRWQVALKVTLPLIKPGIIAASMLSFIYAWNNFIFANVLGSSNVQPVTIAALKFLTLEKIRYGDIAAAAVLILIPALILSFYSQKHMIRGLSMGAIKK